ncbi:hypothetical protein GCM10010232_65780 [Streptomyces amakusaensis]
MVDVPRFPGQRNALRSVPACGKPDGDGPQDPLRLGRTMRLRLLAAVQALLADPSIAGQPDVARLAAVVLFAKSRAPKGRKDDLQTSIWVAELGRWMGVGESTVHRRVLAPMRATDGLHTRVVTDAKGHPTGLDCLVMPLWKARKSGGAGHPLALTKAELATLLRLCEALFGHGWTPEDREPTPPGLLAGRTGKGAATDRLGLLLMVLNTRASGWLQLVGGSVKKREGRGAATVARLLGCSPSGARKVLARLTEAGVVARQHRETSTRMRGRARVMLLPVARAYGRSVAPVEAVQSAGPVFSARPDDACGDHAPADPAGALGTPGIGSAQGPEDAVDQERPDGAELHADHTPLVTPVGSPQLDCGFSGEGRGADGRRPGRACVREDQAADGEASAAVTGSPVVEGGPLRGEQPKKSPAEVRDGQPAAGADAGDRPKAGGWEKAQRQRRVCLPGDLRLRVALGPVSWLWERLSRWQQDQVEAAAKTELTRLTDLGVAAEGAPRLLADRLTDRLAETGGEAMITGPYGWLIRRGLPQRPSCSDQRCDDGIRLDTSGDCANCGNVIHLRRSWRTRAAADVDREQPGLGEDARPRAVETRLREIAALDAEDYVWRREQAREQQTRRDAVRAADQERAAIERAAAEAADVVRQALACEDCGQPRAAGLCEACGYLRRTEAAIAEAGLIAATWAADLDDPADVAAVAADARVSLEADIARNQREFLALIDPDELDADPAAAASALAFAAFQAVEVALPEYRASALGRLGRTGEAETEARRAYATEQNRRWYQHNPHGTDAVTAATKAADTARTRTAQHLLTARLEQLREQTTTRTEQAERAVPWAERLAHLAARPLNDDGGAVIAWSPS